MKSIEEKIIEWAKERDLLKSENAPKQFIKVTEELGELGRAILKNNIAEQIDAIGDLQVTLIILSEQLGLNYNECLISAYNVIKDRTGKTVGGTFIKD